MPHIDIVTKTLQRRDKNALREIEEIVLRPPNTSRKDFQTKEEFAKHCYNLSMQRNDVLHMLVVAYNHSVGIDTIDVATMILFNRPEINGAFTREEIAQALGMALAIERPLNKPVGLKKRCAERYYYPMRALLHSEWPKAKIKEHVRSINPHHITIT